MFTGVEETKEDLTQEAFAHFITNIDKYKGACSITSWMYYSAQHAVRKYLYYMSWANRGKVTKEEFEDYMTTEHTTPETLYAAEEQVKRIKPLPKATQRVYDMYMSNMPYTEIAKRLKVIPTSVQTQVSRAKKRIQEGLDI